MYKTHGHYTRMSRSHQSILLPTAKTLPLNTRKTPNPVTRNPQLIQACIGRYTADYTRNEDRTTGIRKPITRTSRNESPKTRTAKQNIQGKTPKNKPRNEDPRTKRPGQYRKKRTMKNITSSRPQRPLAL